MTPENLLREGLSGWGLAADAAPRLLEFSDRLLEKNRVMNLTAITDPVDVVTLHLLDCAALLRMEDFRGRRVVDVGTGAGFPGMPLRLLEPDFDLTLLDSLGKRVAFLQEVCNAMALQRVTCVHARAEEFAAQERERFDLAVSRAVAPLNVLEIGIRPLSLCMRLFGNVLGAFVVMKLIEHVCGLIIPMVFSMYFDVFDGLIQAYVFVFLTSLFMAEGMEVEEESVPKLQQA